MRSIGTLNCGGEVLEQLKGAKVLKEDKSLTVNINPHMLCF